jgi:hypothetical protein
MYKGSQTAEVHASQVDTMKNRGWTDKKPTAKKPTKKSEVNNDG